MARTSRTFDPARYLDSPEAIAGFLEDAFAGSDLKEIASALGVVARARGMSQLAEETGLSRQALYKALSDDGKPELDTLLKVMKAFDLRLSPVPRRQVEAVEGS
ncbi:MAG: hypothetical protein JWO83_1442 [Caulobacteraceae bacterium]|nr:hypothetical protein [Caulobacteraceae bacterium]